MIAKEKQWQINILQSYPFLRDAYDKNTVKVRVRCDAIYNSSLRQAFAIIIPF